MKKVLSTKKNKAERFTWLVTMIKGKTKKILAQSGRGVDYATANGAKKAFYGLMTANITEEEVKPKPKAKKKAKAKKRTLLRW